MEGMPEDATLQAAWGRALRVLGMVQMSANTLYAALGSLQNSVSKLEKLAERDPANTVSRSDVAWSVAAEGDCLAKMKRHEAAADAHHGATSIWRELKERQAITGRDAARLAAIETSSAREINRYQLRQMGGQ